MSAPTVDVPDSPADLTRSPSLGEYFRGYVDRVRGGDIGSLPAVFGLVVLVLVAGFYYASGLPSEVQLFDVIAVPVAAFALAILATFTYTRTGLRKLAAT